eukprot:TRINITY_DN10242_c0_g1_i1.p1 TRINITY_DN10242_c0_g1~~TRINITY_DN10242_c0_g1_i1.p1  ORF type:complete len:534 (-),score=148.30 TRINITY_DN10242_c0_g1_i1:264-1865(-)
MASSSPASGQKWHPLLQQQLYELLSTLYQLGRDFPQILIFSSEIISPNLPPERRIPILGKMFEELPAVITQNTPQQLHKMAVDPPFENLTFRLLLDFRELEQLVQQMSYLQLLHLSNNIIPPGSLQDQLRFLEQAQQIFQSWTPQTLANHHHVLSDTPLHMERQQLLQLEPQIPWELLHFLIELLKLPLEELTSLQEWFQRLPKKQLQVVLQLIQMEPSALLEIKRRMDSLGAVASLPALSSSGKSSEDLDFEMAQDLGAQSAMSMNQVNSFNSSLPTPSHTQVVSNAVIDPAYLNPKASPLAYSTDSTYQLRMARHPPPRTVYQRILKPFPSVMLVGGHFDSSATTNLFVECTLLRSDSDVEIPLSIEGNKVVRIANGNFAIFKKLKILSTSQQLGTLFRLKFTLKRYVGNIFETIPSAVAISNPIEVFSHTLYLNEKGEAPPAPPVVNEILPPVARVGSRVVVLGSNFVNTPQLRVKFGEVECQPMFHEQGTLICVVPNPHRPITVPVPVRVTNDGLNYCDTRVGFTFVNS